MHPVFRVGLLLVLGLVLLARGLEMLNSHITAASQPDRRARAQVRAAAAAAAAEASEAGRATVSPEASVVPSDLEHADRGVRLDAIRALAFSADEASRRIGARAIATNAGDGDVEAIAEEALAAGSGLDRALAEVAADAGQPGFARDQARYLLDRAGAAR
jgi:hypothetical protein